MTELTVITCTGGRPESFALLKKYIKWKTYKKPFQWLVVDDFEQPIIKPWGFTYVRRAPFWQPGQMTLGLNILEALKYAKGEYILFLEDDDWYAPQYIEEMVKRLKKADLVGNVPAVYYNVSENKYYYHNNNKHASLAQTGIHRRVVPLLKSVCESSSNIDHELFKRADSRYFWHQRDMHIGIKGMPGKRAGYGMGHNPKGAGWHNDVEGCLLLEWIGDDAAFYLKK